MSPALSHSAKLTERRGEKAVETIDSGPGATALRPIQPRVPALTEVTTTESKTPREAHARWR